MTYIHELVDWPNLTWDDGALAQPLAAVRHREGRLIGRMEALGFPLREEAVLRTLTEDVLKSSEIEGEVLDRDQVRSSIARRLGMDVVGLVPADRDVEGVVEMMLDATQNYAQPLTADRLFGWHAALFPTGRSGMSRITVGAWREPDGDPMQVVSGPVGRERVHYEAPAADRLDAEAMRVRNRTKGWKAAEAAQNPPPAPAAPTPPPPPQLELLARSEGRGRQAETDAHGERDDAPEAGAFHDPGLYRRRVTGCRRRGTTNVRRLCGSIAHGRRDAGG